VYGTERALEGRAVLKWGNWVPRGEGKFWTWERNCLEAGQKLRNEDFQMFYNRITPIKSPSFCTTTFSASLTSLTPLPPQSHDSSRYVSRPIPAPPRLWLQKQTDQRAHGFAHSPDLWHQHRLANVTAPKDGDFVELILLQFSPYTRRMIWRRTRICEEIWNTRERSEPCRTTKLMSDVISASALLGDSGCTFILEKQTFSHLT